MSLSRENIIRVIKKQGIIALFYKDDAEVSAAVVDALYNAGIRIIEYTNRGTMALKNFKILLEKRCGRWPELLLSVGTIKTVATAKEFIEAGADFIICPGVIPAVADVVNNAGLLWVPGCMAPTEIIIAEQNDAKLVKLFPGSLLGPSYIAAVKEVFPDLLFMPTGGVEVHEENLNSWFNAGAVAVGLGSKVISKESVMQKNYIDIEAIARRALQMIQAIKARK